MIIVFVVIKCLYQPLYQCVRALNSSLHPPWWHALWFLAAAWMAWVETATQASDLSSRPRVLSSGWLFLRGRGCWRAHWLLQPARVMCACLNCRGPRIYPPSVLRPCGHFPPFLLHPTGWPCVYVHVYACKQSSQGASHHLLSR